MRINRFLASAGLGSRRACEDLVRSGRVLVNNAVVTDLATKVGAEDIVRVGRKIVKAQAHVYLLLNKPKGYLCTRSDEKGRKTIFDLVPSERGRLFHVGRLDMESEGLIILTNDGDFAEQLTHPSHLIEKEYEVLLHKDFDPAHSGKLLRGMTLEAGRAKMEAIHIVAPRKLKIILRQGLKRQIREMLWGVGGYDVTKLFRTRIGGLSDPRLKTGYWRPLDQEEVELLRKTAKPVKRPAKGAGPKSDPSTPRPDRKPFSDKREAGERPARKRFGNKRPPGDRPARKRPTKSHPSRGARAEK